MTLRQILTSLSNLERPYQKGLLNMTIKPGPKPRKEDGTRDKRRRVTPENKPKHPPLKPHKHKK